MGPMTNVDVGVTLGVCNYGDYYWGRGPVGPTIPRSMIHGGGTFRDRGTATSGPRRPADDGFAADTGGGAYAALGIVQVCNGVWLVRGQLEVWPRPGSRAGGGLSD